MLKQDRNALEGMPLRLLLAALMICLATPVLFDSLASFQHVSGASIMQGQIEKVQRAALEICRQGLGSQRTITIELPSDDCALLIGGRSTSESMSLGYAQQGKTPVRVYLTDPNVRFITENNNTVSIQGMQTIVLRCANDEQGFAVEVLL